MGEQGEFRHTGLAPRRFPAIVQIDRGERDGLHIDGTAGASPTFEEFAQHAFDYVTHSLDRAHEQIEQLTSERDIALARLRELEREVAPGSQVPERVLPSGRPWRTILLCVPVEPVSRVRWAIAFLLLLALPLLGIMIVEPTLRPHAPFTIPDASILEPAAIAALVTLLIGTLVARTRR